MPLFLSPFWIVHACTMCRHVTDSRTTPLVDANQDVVMTMAEQVEGETTIAFTRTRITSDSPSIDVALDIPVFFLWATGTQVDLSTQNIFYHGSNRGVSSQMILLPSATECPFSGKIKNLPSWVFSLKAILTYIPHHQCI